MAHTFLNVSSVLLSHGLSRKVESWAVVGNGPLFVSDHARILMSDVVVRFNDVKNKWSAERTDIHVIRHPSWFTLKQVSPQLTWHVGALSHQIPGDAELVSYVFETQHSSSNMTSRDARIFPSCNCGESCLHRSTWAGPSTGAVSISALEEDPGVRSIEVFGMNWNGDKEAHVDFKNNTIVSNCCTKCYFHKTRGDDYGDQGAILFLIFVGSMVSLLTLFLLYKVERGGEYVFGRYYRSSTPPYARTMPLLPFSPTTAP